MNAIGYSPEEAAHANSLQSASPVPGRHEGLTKREAIAAQMMAAFIADNESGAPPEVLAGWAVDAADKLLFALETRPFRGTIGRPNEQNMD